MAVSQVPISTDAFTHKVTAPAWKTKPTWYMVATADRSINPDQESMMGKRANAKMIEVNAIHRNHPRQCKNHTLQPTTVRDKLRLILVSAGVIVFARYWGWFRSVLGAGRTDLARSVRSGRRIPWVPGRKKEREDKSKHHQQSSGFGPQDFNGGVEQKV
jgi:hypothetical protein